MKPEAREYFLKHGTIEGYYEGQIKKNDWKWFVTLVLVCVIFIGFYAENRVSVKEVASVQAHELADSLKVCYQAKLDSIVKASYYDPAEHINIKNK